MADSIGPRDAAVKKTPRHDFATTRPARSPARPHAAIVARYNRLGTRTHPHPHHGGASCDSADRAGGRASWRPGLGAAAPETLPPVTHGSLLVRTEVGGPLQEVPGAPDRRPDPGHRPDRAGRGDTGVPQPDRALARGGLRLPAARGRRGRPLCLQVGERIIEGQVREREEARRTYQQARRGRQEGVAPRAGAAERLHGLGRQHRARRGASRSTIEYQELVRYDQGEFRLRFPMVVGPRYIPGTDADRGARAPAGASNTTECPTRSGSRRRCAIRPRGRSTRSRSTVELDAGFPLPPAGQPVPPDRHHADGRTAAPRSPCATAPCRRTATSSSPGRPSRARAGRAPSSPRARRRSAMRS